VSSAPAGGSPGAQASALPSDGTRLDRLRALLTREELDALLVIAPPNRRWLAGFTGSAGTLLISADAALLATDFRYWEQAAAQAPAFELVPEGDRGSGLPIELLAGLGGSAVGFEPRALSVAEHAEWSDAIEALPAAERPRLVAAPGLVEELRLVKEPAEVEAIARAAALTDACTAHAEALAQPGTTERELAWALQRYAMEHGAERLAFDSIVAAGPHGALPHAVPRDVALERGQPVVLDLGVVVGGYCSDLTRTVVVGGPSEADETFRRIYDVVLSAQTMAIERIEAGMTGAQAHSIAAAVIEEAGYGDRFGHGLGHGVGLQVHEAPRLRPGADHVLADGQVMTVEPGVYLPGWGGVRIEDMCVMEDGRLRPLSRAAKLGAGAHD
jgi:Xaa-Pro aminopeptidase